MVRFFRLYAPTQIVQQIAEQPTARSVAPQIVQQVAEQFPLQAFMARYALESSALPIGVSDYVLERFIPADFKSQMPTIEEVEDALTRRLAIAEARQVESATASGLSS